MKKAQVTIFVILGLIALITIFITISVLRFDETDVVERQELVSDDSRLAPVSLSIESCQNNLGKEALKIIGQKGGYLETPQVVLRDIGPSYSNTAVKLFENSDYILPYWRGIASSPDCTECQSMSMRPPLETNEDLPENVNDLSIQAQVESYIESNLLSCVNAFQDFEELDIEYGEPEVNVDFRNQDTRIETFIDLDITVIDSQTQYQINYFTSELDIPFRSIYGIASNILFQVVNGENALEDLSKEILATYAGVSTSSSIPPINGGIDISLSGPTFWTLSEVKELITNSLEDNINYLQIYDSYESQRLAGIEDQFLDRFINEFSYGISGDRDVLGDTKIRFNYQKSFPTFVQVLPSRSELIMPEKVPSTDIPFFPITAYDYSFQYDVTYPAVISLENNQAYNGEGYYFNFAVESNIRSNEHYNIEVVDDLSRIPGISFNDPTLRSNPISIRVTDYNGLAVDEVVVKMECLGQNIVLGETSVENGQSILETNAPSCSNAKIYSDGPDYFSDTYSLLIDSQNEVEEIDLTVYKEQELDVSIRKKTLLYDDLEQQMQNFRFISGVDTLESNENVDIIFTRINEQGRETDYIRAYSTAVQEDKLSIAPGNYNVLITGTKSLATNFTTQDEMIEPDVPFIVSAFGNSPDPVKINGTDLGRDLFLGMLELKDDNYVSIEPEDFSKEITFYLPSVNYDSIEFTRHLQALSRTTLLEPEEPEIFKPKKE